MLTVRKAVFPVAGLGTRFLPATKANPKEMLPIVDKPLIQYAVEEAINAGITQLIFVTNSSKRAIEDHFDSNFELESKLKEQGKEELLTVVRNILPPHVTAIYIRQAEALGLGHAILCAKEVIGNEPFAVLLADDLISNTGSSCLQQMLDQYKSQHCSLVAVQEIEAAHSDQYGMVSLLGSLALGHCSGIRDIIEKPKPCDAPSRFGVVGRYVLTPHIFKFLQTIKPGPQGELQLTDAIAALLVDEKVAAYSFLGQRYDCGSKLGYLQAIVNYGLQHAQLGTPFLAYLKQVLPQNERKVAHPELVSIV
jgi:UTP--glucose-1-phosphate uridylyltransferase